MRILLVDDEPLLHKSYARLLKMCMDQEVVTAANGAEALAELEVEEPFDAIICDVSMPGMSGVDLHGEVCERHPELVSRFVFLSGGITNEGVAEYIQRSGTRVLEKPVERAVLEKALVEMTGV